MKTIWQKLKHNLGKKIIALLFAVLIWSFVISVNDPLRTRSVSNVPINIAGLDKLEQAGLIVRNQEVFDPVTMRVDVKVSETNRLNLNVVQVTADLSNIQRKGQYEIYLKGTTSVGDVVAISPSVITLDVDERTTRSIPVSYYYTGQISDSLFHLPPVLSVSKVEITGAQQDVARVTSAVCEINLSAIDESVNGIYPLKLLDKDNQEVSSDLFVSTLPSVSVLMSVYPKSTVSINQDVSACIENTGLVAKGYRIAGISFSQDSLAVYGPQEMIASLSVLNIHPVSVKGLTASKTFQIELILPKDVFQVSEMPITMTVVIEKIQ